MKHECNRACRWLDDAVGCRHPLLAQEKGRNCTRHHFKDESGVGVMTRYPLFPGIELLFNDMNLFHLTSTMRADPDMFCVAHCKHGRIEWAMPEGCQKMESGEVHVHVRSSCPKSFHFPSGRYHGVTVVISPAEAMRALPGILEGYPLDLYAVKRFFCTKGISCPLRLEPAMIDVFGSLYALPARAWLCHARLKVLEMLLILSGMSHCDQVSDKPYFPRHQVEKVRRIQRFLLEDLGQRHTLEELSSRFEIPVTSMKSCFKGIVGMSLQSWVRDKRMQEAARLLRHTSRSVATIAGCVGYDNASKFAAAFAALMGVPPLQYRKGGDCLEHFRSDWSGN